jgi:hypothetical protein
LHVSPKYSVNTKKTAEHFRKKESAVKAKCLKLRQDFPVAKNNKQFPRMYT